MRLASLQTRDVTGQTTHLCALVEADADNSLAVDLTAAGRTLFVSEGLPPAGADRLARALLPADLLAFIEGGRRSREAAEQAVSSVIERGWEQDPSGAQIRFRTDVLTFRPPIVEPPMLRDFMAFEQHLLNIFPRLGREVPDEWYRRPVYYKANTASIGAHRQDVALPSYAPDLDFEFEFAAVLGRSGINISEERALDCVFGYTIYNDFSAREVQSAEMTVGLGPAKGKDFTAAHVLGPVVVTADELGSPYGHRMRGWVNGEQWTDGTTADMHWRFEQMIAYASWGEPVRAGEIFGSGTVGGGSGAEQGKALHCGDVVELEVAGIGRLRNRVVAASAEGHRDLETGNLS